MQLLSALLLVTLAAHAERIDRVVAVVGDRVVTSWDLALEEALGPHLPCPEPVLCDPKRPLVQRLVDRALVRGLAGDTPTYRPSSEEVELRLAALREAWPTASGTDFDEQLALLGLSEGNLAGLLYSRMVVERYVHRHVALPVYASGGDLEALDERYDGWIREQRSQIRIRLVEPEVVP